MSADRVCRCVLFVVATVVCFRPFAARAEETFEISLVPTAAGLERTLTAWYDNGGEAAAGRLEDDELARLGKLYSQQLSGPGELRQQFRGTFAEMMPRDVGVRGYYRRIETPLGTVHRYLERFRGCDDLDADIYDRRAAVDRMVDFVSTWFDEQLKDAPEREAVHRFVHQELRQDFRKLVHATWLQEAMKESNDDAETEAQHTEWYRRVEAYCVERGYLEPREAARLIEAVAGGDDLSTLRRALARGSKLNVADADRTFAFISDTAEVGASFTESLRRTPEYRLLEKQARASAPQGVPADPPDPTMVAMPLFQRAFFPGGDDEPKALRLSLKVVDGYVKSNGEFDAEQNVVRWNRKLRPIGLPALCFADWAVADEAFQKKHFKRTAVEGDLLIMFAERFDRLPEARRKEFADHLHTLKPGDALRDQVNSFSFAEPIDEPTRQMGDDLKTMLHDSL